MRRIGLALLTVLSLSSVGCPSPSIYGTARTTPPKRWSHTIAAEGFGTMEREFQGGLPVRDRFVATPTMPTYQLRYGLSESADVGFRVANLASAGLDVKFCFLKDAVVDLAIDPMAQIGYEPAFYGSRDHNRMYLHLPFIVDLNLSETASVVVTPGAMYGFSDRERDDNFHGVFLRLGLGLNARLSRRFAIQPEVTFLGSPHRESSTPLVMLASLGFNIGSLPSFGDTGSGGEEH